MADLEVSVRLKYVRLKEDDLLSPGGAAYEAAERAGRAGVQYVRDELKRMDAIDSGELYDSVDYGVYRSGRGIAVSVNSNSPHAKYVEYGTRSPIPAAGPKWMPVQIKNGPFLLLTRVNGQDPQPAFRNALKKVSAEDWR